jgi:hypothetical protein
MKYLSMVSILFLLTTPLIAQQYTIQWADTVDNGSEDFAYGIALDAHGNVYVTGKSIIGANYDYLTIKYDPAGNTLWADTVDNGGDDIAGGVAVDLLGDGSVFVAGHSRMGANADFHPIKYDSMGNILASDTVDFGYNDLAFGISANGPYPNNNFAFAGESDNGTDIDFMILKYDPSLLPHFFKTIDNGGDDHGRRAVLDANDNLYATGYSSIGSNYDYYTVMYDLYGTFVWADTFDNGGNDLAWDIALDANKNVYVTGQSYNAGADDFLTIKYDSLGTFLWGDTPGIGDFAFGLAVDPQFNIYVAGRRYNGSDFDDLVIKYDSSGILIWADTIDNGDTEYFWDIAVDAAENIYVTGHSIIGGDADYFTVKYLCLTATNEYDTPSRSPMRNEIKIASICRTAASYSYHTAQDGQYSLSLHSIDGRMMLNLRGCGKGSHTAQLPVLAPGIYFLRLEQNGAAVVKKIAIIE